MREYRDKMIYSGEANLTNLQYAIDRHMQHQGRFPEKIYVGEVDYPKFVALLPVNRYPRFKGIRIIPI